MNNTGRAERQRDARNRGSGSDDNNALARDIANLQQRFEELRTWTEPYVRARIAKRVGVDQRETEEMLAQVYEQIWRAIRSFDPARVASRLWFMTVVDHAIAGYFRKTKKLKTEALSDEIPDERLRDMELVLERQRGFTLLWQALSRLKPAWRDILLLTAMYPEMEYEDIATAMNVPSIQAARQLKYRAIMGIREVLRQMGVGHDVLSLLYR